MDYYQGCKTESSWVKGVFFFYKKCVFLKFIILKVKIPGWDWPIVKYIILVFLSSRPIFLFIKSIKIGSFFSRFGYPKIRKDRDPCGGEVPHQFAASTGPGVWCLKTVTVSQMWSRRQIGKQWWHATWKAKHIYTYAGQ